MNATTNVYLKKLKPLPNLTENVKSDVWFLRNNILPKFYQSFDLRNQ